MIPRIYKSPFWRRALSVIGVLGMTHGPALAGDTFAPNPPAPDPAQCTALGEGFHAASGSDGCIRISGYIAVGEDFAGPGHVSGAALGPFAARPNAALETRTDVGPHGRLDTEMGPGRLYVQFRRDGYPP